MRIKYCANDVLHCEHDSRAACMQGIQCFRYPQRGRILTSGPRIADVWLIGNGNHNTFGRFGYFYGRKNGRLDVNGNPGDIPV